MVGTVEFKPQSANGSAVQLEPWRRGIRVVTGTSISGNGIAACDIALVPGEAASRERFLLAEATDPIPHARIAAVAYELWAMQGGNDVLNWLEAERLLRRVFAADRRDMPQAHSPPVGAAIDGCNGP